MNQTLEMEQKIKEEVPAIIDHALKFHVTTYEQSVEAVDILQQIKAQSKKVSEVFDPICDAQHKAWKISTEKRGSFLDPLKKVYDLLRSRLNEYNDIQEAKRQKEIADAEAKRQEEERKEKEKLNAQAEKLEAKGKTEQAEAKREQAENVTVVPAYQPPPPLKPKGQIIVKKWKCQITDAKQALKALETGIVPLHVIEWKQSALDDLAKLHKDSTKIPGFRFFEETDTRVRG